MLLAFSFRIWKLAEIPSGLLWDEGGSGLDVLPLFHSQWPVFFEAHSGHEPLLFYAQALSLKWFGWSPLSLRLPAVFFTTLAVAAGFLAIRRLFGVRVALVASFLMAVAQWQVSMGRLGRDNSALPLFASLSVFWLIVWMTTRRSWAAAALCGLCFGLVLYTYSPGRFLIFVVAVVWLRVFAEGSRGRLALIKEGAVFAVSAVLVFLPLAYYFLHHPSSFLERAGQLSIFNPAFGPPVANWLRAVQATLLMFSFTGEPGWDKTSSGQPMFDPVTSVFFMAGLVLALYRWRRLRYFVVLVWASVMLVPLMLTARDLPDFGRVIGIAPAIFVFPALAVDELVRRWHASRWFLYAGATALAAFSCWQYFAVWENAPGRLQTYRPEVLAAAQSTVGRLLEPNPPSAVYLGAPDDHDAVTDFVIAGLDTEHPALAPRLIGYDARYTRVLPPAGAESYVIAPGRPAITSLPAPEKTLSTSLEGGAVQLRGYDLPVRVAPGHVLEFRVEWRPSRASTIPVTFFAHLLDYSQQRGVASLDQNGFPAGEWRGGEIVLSTFPLDVAPTTPTGVYWLEFGAYTDGGRRLQIAQGEDRLLLGPVVIAPANSINQTPIAEMGGVVGLLPSRLSQTGQILDVHLRWLPRQPFGQDYSVFLHILDGAGKLVAQADGPPAGGQWPTRYWLAGVPVDDGRAVTLPAGLPAGRYVVAAGLYRLDTGERLEAVPAGPEPGSALVGSIRLD